MSRIVSRFIIAIVWATSTAGASDAQAADAVQQVRAQWTRLGQPTLDVPAGILAYSGMAVDAKRGQILLFGGGHNDYWGNEVWAFDLNKRTWRRLTDPTPRQRYFETRFDWGRWPGMFPDLKVPVSRHTYDSVEFIDHLGMMFAAGSSTFSGSSRDNLWSKYVEGAGVSRKDMGWGSFDAWLFDPAKTAWEYRRPPAEMGDGGNLCAYAADARLLVVMRSGSWGGFRGPMLYDPQRDQWKRAKAMTAKIKPDTGIHQTATYDTKRRCVYLVGGSKSCEALWAWSMEKDEWQAIRPAAGETPQLGDGAGSAYDGDRDVLVTFGPRGTWLYWPEKNVWQSVGAGGPQPQEIHGRLQYDSARKQVLMVSRARSGVEVWALEWSSP